MDKITDLPKKYYPTINELPGDLCQIAQIIEAVCPSKGVEATLAISQAFRGTEVYFRNMDNICRKARNTWLVEQYSSGQRVADLARKIGLSERQVWNIIGS